MARNGAKNGEDRYSQHREMSEIAPEGAGWRKLLSPPVLPDEEEGRVAGLLHTILLILFAGTIATYFTVFSTENPLGVLVVVSGLLAVVVTSFILLRLGKVRWSAAILSVGLWLTLFVISIIAAGVSNSPFIGLILVVVIAGLILGGKAGLLFALLTSLAGFGLSFLESSGLLPQPLIPFNLTSFWISLSVVFFAVAGLISLTSRSMTETLQRARASERAQIEINQELQGIRDTLELQVAERTHDLEQRTSYLQASFEVSRAAASILDTDHLIHEVVNLIRDQFSLYYVGLFLIDASGEWAVLRAGTGLAGRAMLERGHRIKVGSGMIGWSIAHARPRMSLEADTDAVRLSMPELPETRSEAAIPLFSRGRVLGALSVQSNRPNAFGETEISAFQAMADQVAIALDNARLFAESQNALEEAQRAYGEVSRHAWQEFLHRGMNLSYRYENQAITPLITPLALTTPTDQSEHGTVQSGSRYSPEMRRALMNGEPWQTISDENATLFLPITVRDQVIGVINVTKQVTDHGWTDEDTTLLSTIIDQLGIALDSARLFEETQDQAERERLVDEVTSQMRATLDIENVLKTAAREIRNALELAEVEVRIGNVVDLPTALSSSDEGNRASSEEQYRTLQEQNDANDDEERYRTAEHRDEATQAPTSQSREEEKLQ